MKLKIWLDSGANIHSCYEVIVTLEEMNVTKEEWDEMTDEEKDDFCREIAFSRSDWGYEEIEE